MMAWLHSLTGPEILACSVIAAIFMVGLLRVALVGLLFIWWAIDDDRQDPPT